MSAARFLIIEDDELMRQALAQQLRCLGHEHIDEAPDGPSARRALDAPTHYDWIVADLMLPGQDTVELLRAARPRSGPTRLILISSLGEGVLRSVAVLCRERGLRVAGAMRKPVRPEALRELLGRDTTASTAPRADRAPAVTDLQRALETRGIGAVVQPKISAADGSLQGVEVLSRWNDARLGEIPSARLALLAESNGLGGALMQYMIGLALRTCADWSAQGRLVPVSINLGGRTLRDLGLPDYVDRTLKFFQLQPELLCLEVGEHALLDHADALDVLSRVRMRGVRVALDNFGTGQASALRMQRLPLTELKIDPSFVRCLPGSGVGAAVVDFAVRLARGLGIQTTAVGVENAAQAESLRAMGCDHLQGYWISRPMAPEQLMGWVQARPDPSSPPSVPPVGATGSVDPGQGAALAPALA